jgi:hypothetical protein
MKTLLFISFLFNGDYQKMAVWLLAAAILAIIPNVASLVDLHAGIQASKRLGVFKTTSYGLRQTVSKDRDYLMYFFLLFLIDCCLSFFVGFPVLCSLCAISETAIEVISVRENTKKGRSGNNHDPIELMQSIATAYGEDKAKKIFDILKESKDNGTKNC